MFDMNAYSVAVYGVPLGYFGSDPAASQPEPPEAEYNPEDRVPTVSMPDPWADLTDQTGAQ